jgi:hypothetical protein
MKNYFHKINQTYVESFFLNIKSLYKGENIHTDSKFLRSILRGINDLFKLIGGQISTKDDIPKEKDYPDAEKFNKLITDINNDVHKIFTSQKLIENDVTNLLNFNSSQRLKTFENLTSAQQEVYSLYIKNKRYAGRELLIPSSNPFTSSDNMSVESNGVTIDQSRGILTLSSETSYSKPVDVNNVKIFFSTSIPENTIYPSNIALGVGSHWDIPGRAPAHFIGNNLSDLESYKQMMIDTPNQNTGIGWCEFEAVRTQIDTINKKFEASTTYRLNDLTNGTYDIVYSNRFLIPDELAIKTYIGRLFNRDAESIYFDIPNSLQGKYISTGMTPLNFTNPQYKLVIPFNPNSIITNEITLDLEPDDLGYYPKIIWKESKVFTNQNGADVAYTLAEPAQSNDVTQNGEYKCLIKNGYIKPARLELIIEYGSDALHWVPIGFNMSHYNYSVQQNYSLIDPNQGEILLILDKSYDIFVDSEADPEMEKTRALNVLTSRRK